MHIPVSHTNGRSIKNMIGMFMHRLVSMDFKANMCQLACGPWISEDLQTEVWNSGCWPSDSCRAIPTGLFWCDRH